MSITLSNPAILEISNLSAKAESLARGSVSDRAQSTILVQRISTIRQTGISSDEMRGKYADALVESLDNHVSQPAYERGFVEYLAGRPEEIRGLLLAGSQSITYTGLATGGAVVPISTYEAIIAAEKTVTSLVDKNVVTLIESPTFTATPETIKGWDLSTITSQQVGEGQPDYRAIAPVVTGRSMNPYTFRSSLSASLEADTDITNINSNLATAFGVGLARGEGALLTNGTGTGQPQGIWTAAAPSGIVIASGTYSKSNAYIVQEELNNLFFSINRIYRSSAKCAWLMPDSVYRLIRLASDNMNRPLLEMQNDREVLLGKPIYIEPNLPEYGGSPFSNGGIIFGDLSHFIVKASAIWIQRSLQSAASVGSVLAGEATYHARQRVDSFLMDPSFGVNPPIVRATVGVA